jgi:pSer/pThr/pTyr-binding forkhead associated (FHA) protein
MDGAVDPIFAGRRAGGVSVVLRARGQTWRVTPERPWTIGRAAEADVRLDDPRISRRHATLEPTADGWVLVGHGANGIFVDRRRVERLAVPHQVTVSLGAEEGVIMQLQAEPASAPDAATQVAELRPAQPSQLSPANWYPDPAGSGWLRYFTGTEWTDRYAAPSPGHQQPPDSAVLGQSYSAGPPGYFAPARGHQAAPAAISSHPVWSVMLSSATTPAFGRSCLPLDRALDDESGRHRGEHGWPDQPSDAVIRFPMVPMGISI